MSASRGESISAVRSALATGRLQEAEALAKKALRFSPDEPELTLLLGIVVAKMGKAVEAANLLSKNLEVDPDSFDANLWLAIVLRGQSRAVEALPFARKAVSIRPDDVKGYFQSGLCYLELQHFSEAARTFSFALKIDPKAPVLHELRGRALQALGLGREAVAAFKEASALDPGNERILRQLGSSLLDDYDSQAAVACARRILKINPQSLEGGILYALALLADQQGERATEVITGVLENSPKSTPALLAAGKAAYTLGRFEDAERYYRKSFDLGADQGQAFFGITQTRRITGDDLDLVSAMQNLSQSDFLPREELGPIHYALGKSYDDLGEYQKAMVQFDMANKFAYEIKFGSQPCDRDGMVAANDHTVKVFGKNLLSRATHIGSDSRLPIFVIGMMRSGTSLLDQILSSHPDVGSVGERVFWQSHRDLAFDRTGAIDPENVKNLARQYQSFLQESAPGKSRVVDKMPDNYLVLGLMHVAFPSARILHVKRNPVDTALSIYVTPNSSRISWAHNKGNIVFAYNEYLRLMRHWAEVIPNDRILELNYEDIVRDREATTRQVVGFCGLEWNDLCLHHETNERTVTTPSAWQVRQPIYTRSVERWRRYEPWLGEFSELL